MREFTAARSLTARLASFLICALYTGFTIQAKEGTVAQRVTVVMTDDIDGTEAAETIAFRVDGTAYEIDLSTNNAAKMRQAFGRYIEHARKATGGRRTGRPRRDRHVSSAVREWAKQQGIQVNERGRIPASVVSQYEEAHT